jgi:hypothetical protein
MRQKIVAKRVLMLLVAAAACSLPSTAAAKLGEPLTPLSVVPAGSPYRYVAISPAHSSRLTIVERIARDGGRINGWWTIPGDFQLPPVTFNGSGDGVSADGGTLVLSRFSPVYPPRRTEIAVLDTRIHPRHPDRPGRLNALGAITRVRLSHSYTFHAISPHGTTIYLDRHLSQSVEGPFEVRTMRTGGRRGATQPLDLPQPAPEGRTAGAMLDQVTSAGGRWAYSLYGGKRVEPFLYALDTIRARATRIDLPPIHFAHDYRRFELALRMESGGGRIAVLNRRASIPGSRPLFSVDSKTLEVSKAGAPEPTGSVASGWPLFALGVCALVLGAWGIRRRRSAAEVP